MTPDEFKKKSPGKVHLGEDELVNTTEDLVKIRLEFNASTQKILTKYQYNNEIIENLIQKGIEKAIDDLTNESQDFADVITEETKIKLSKVISKTVREMKFNYILEKAILEKLRDKVGEYTEKIVEGIIIKIQ